MNAKSYPVKLSAIQLFSDLGEEEIKKIAALFIEGTYERGRLIVSSGEAAEEFFLIQHGVIRVYRLNEAGEQVVLALLSSGDFFGEMGLFTDSFRTAWVEAITDARLYIMRKVDFRNLLLDFPQISWKMLGTLSRRLAKTDEHLENMVFLNVEERLLKALRMLAKEFGWKQGHTWMLSRGSVPNLTHRLLAEMAGTSRESVTRALIRLEEKGLVIRGDKGVLFLSSWGDEGGLLS